MRVIFLTRIAFTFASFFYTINEQVTFAEKPQIKINSLKNAEIYNSER